MHPMPRNLDLTLLRTFVTVAERASMTVSAKVLHASQGAISQQVKRLEDALGAPLFIRGRAGLRLTAPGELLLGKARRMLALNDEIILDLTSPVVSGRVRLGAPPDLVEPYLAPVLKRFAAAYPAAEALLTCGPSPALLAALARGELDLAITEAPITGISGECLFVDRLVWVGARAGHAHESTPLPLSLVAGTCAFRSCVQAALTESGRPWRTVFESGSLEATTAMVRADLAITARLASTIPSGLARLQPGPALPQLPPFAITLHLPSPATSPAQSPIRAELARLLRAAFPPNAQAA